MLLRCFICLIGSVLGSQAFGQSLVRVGDVWSYLPGLTEPSQTVGAWQLPNFDDRSWSLGRSGFSIGFVSEEATVLPTSLIPYSSAYFRRNFVLTNLNDLHWLSLRVDYCDGFAAYLNGREVVRRNLPGGVGTPVPSSTRATNMHPRAYPEEYELSAFAGALAVGTNVLAVQVHAVDSLSPLCFSAELVGNYNRAPYLQNMSSNRVQIIWKTPVPATTIVHYGTSIEPDQILVNTNLVTTHAAALEALQPNTVYRYSTASAIGDAQATSFPSTFRTFKPEGGIRFIAFGDAGWNSIPQYQLADVIQKSDADFVVEAGDIVYPAFITSLVDQRLFSVHQSKMMTTPYFFAIGNHDLLDGPNHYLESFYLPTNSVSLTEHAAAQTSPEHYYSFDQGDAHFVVLFVPFLIQHKPKVGDAQYNWLVDDLANTHQPWKIVIWHVPMFSSSVHRFDDTDLNGLYDRNEVRDVFLPVLARFGVQLLLCGHEHGYERFSPMQGVHAITTGGGGVHLYGFSEFDPASALYWSRYNCVQVSVERDHLEASALGTDGEIFDRMVIQRTLPVETQYASAWHSPSMPTNTVIATADGNIPGQVFDFQSTAIPTLTGQFSNLGWVHVDVDATNLYVGLERVMISRSNSLFLFIDSPRLPGVTTMAGLGNGLIDPLGEGADGLDFLSNLSFTNFSPAIGCILGNEFGDGIFRSFTNTAPNLGQGVFSLAPGLPEIAAAQIQQFHLSPQIVGPPSQGNAQFIEVAIPLTALGNLRSGDIVRIGAVVGGPELDPIFQTRELDTGYLGTRFVGGASSPSLLTGVAVALAYDPLGDVDGDGLAYREELNAGTDPNRSDTDGDGLPDGWEVRHGLNPLSAIAEEGATGDLDRDGFSNLAEWLAGTDPTDPASNLQLGLTHPDPWRLELSWQAMAGRTYQVEASTGSTTNFYAVPGASFQVLALRTNLSYSINVSPAAKAMTFFRVQVMR